MSLALDGDDQAHIAFAGGDGLCVATNAAGEWSAEIVEDPLGPAGEDVSLVMDSAGFAHVAYEADSALRYATNASGAWESAAVDGDRENRVLYAAVALDGTETPHVAYSMWRLAGEDELRYAAISGGLWETESVDTRGTSGTYVDLAIGADAIHISHVDGADGELRYAAHGLPDGVDNNCDGVEW